MNQDESIIRAIESIETQTQGRIGFQDLQVIRHHASLLWVSGYEEGRKVGREGTPVVMMREGAIIRDFDSLADAARFLGCDKVRISEAVGGLRKTYKGFSFRYKGREHEWKYKRKPQKSI